MWFSLYCRWRVGSGLFGCVARFVFEGNGRCPVGQDDGYVYRPGQRWLPAHLHSFYVHNNDKTQAQVMPENIRKECKYRPMIGWDNWL